MAKQLSSPNFSFHRITKIEQTNQSAHRYSDDDGFQCVVLRFYVEDEEYFDVGFYSSSIDGDELDELKSVTKSQGFNKIEA